MNVTLVGTGSILCSATSACAVIDNKIAVDVPNGSVKAQRRLGISPSGLDACLITHFHADHYFDVVFLLLEVGLRKKRDTDFWIVGPSGLQERVKTLFDLGYPESWDRVLENGRVRFKELPDRGGTFSLVGYQIKAVKVKHTTPVAFGYLVLSDHGTLGYSGDTEYCRGVRRIVSESDVAVVDVSFISARSGHMGVPDVKRLAEAFPAVRLIGNHMTDEVRNLCADFMEIPSDGFSFQV